ncbi:hypothetical protein C2E23DRAFT_832305 [Lenzites betulinus]|nr:hypothetical protein C2E23DRAFT_832305 [Lenzites betulinus]
MNAELDTQWYPGIARMSLDLGSRRPSLKSVARASLETRPVQCLSFYADIAPKFYVPSVLSWMSYQL